MKSYLKISLFVFTMIILCTIAISKINAMEVVEQPIGAIVYETAPARQPRAGLRSIEYEQLRQQIQNLERLLQSQNTTRQPSRQNQIDQSIERLGQITREAEEIRERINNLVQQSQTQIREVLPRNLNLNQRFQSAVGAARERLENMPQNQPINTRPRLERVIENIPQVIEQLRNAFNNNIERVQNSFQRVQERLTDIQAETERLKNENRELREENQILKDRIQELESR